jgi:hypothetical protein
LSNISRNKQANTLLALYRNGKIVVWNKGHTKEEFPQLANGGRPVGSRNSYKCHRKVALLTEEHKKQISDSLMGHPGHTYTDIERHRMSEAQKRLWKDPEHAKKILHRRTLSDPEQMFIKLCIERKLQCRFVGNGELLIGRKNPDFVGIRNEHKLIEIWGEYFKVGRNPQDLIDFYRTYGYDCLVIWASELKDIDTIYLRVERFLEE